MQAPPVGEHKQGNAPRRNNTVIWVVIAVVFGGGCVLIAILAAVLMPVFSQARQAAREKSSFDNLRQLGLALQMYADTADDHLPMANRWMDATKQFVEKSRTYNDPATGNDGKGQYGYAMNKGVSGASVNEFERPHETVVLFTSTVIGRNAVGTEADIRTMSRDRFIASFGDTGVKKRPRAESGNYVWILPPPKKRT